MTKRKRTPTPPQPAESCTLFEVCDGGTLRMADFFEAQTRADFYEHIGGGCGAPMALAETMARCQPLAWAVHSIYSDFRGEIESDLKEAQAAGSAGKRRIVALKARLSRLPEEPEDGAVAWLLGLTSQEFKGRVEPEVEKWFAKPPNWSFEDDYLPESSTAQGAALEFFRDLSGDERIALGVKVIEGEFPGSTYYAAELQGDIDKANRTAEAARIPVRFLAAID